ncbi:LytTR family DNA-binding domain-containing protein [Ciceribacter sp. RN22]|uniref:LytTR family DNA-binding domain-containing protein n=1 Tax=Ciceribacter sp. RN22 TaxID=2954932 RepID=UPI00209247FD|nr:LytTR family DNA-binding domain-containing protein [Ciceribacter sp. RN22]MCO6178853.1 LytTR family transcriptional regulator [Ciceribacter sp. RN22]
MAYEKMQSALRELCTIAAARRLWLTFTLVVALFTVTGPFGTAERMFVGARFSYWLMVHALAWSISITFAIMADVYLAGILRSRPLRVTSGSLLAALPVALALQGFDMAFDGRAFSLAALRTDFAITLPLCALFCLLTWLTMSGTLLGEAQQAVRSQPPCPPSVSAREPATTQNPAPILLRLNPEHRATLLRLSSDDHYTEVVTRRGRELVLVRFSDALAELGETQGLRVHRSHWIADEHVAGLQRDGRRLFVLTADGDRIAVSRPYEAAARGRFGAKRQT